MKISLIAKRNKTAANNGNQRRSIIICYGSRFTPHTLYQEGVRRGVIPRHVMRNPQPMRKYGWILEEENVPATGPGFDPQVSECPTVRHLCRSWFF